MPTLLDIAKRNGSDSVVGLIDETSRVVPEVSGIHPDSGVSLRGVADSRTIAGLHYKTLIRTTLPSVSFRDANQGTAYTGATYENRLVETFIMNPRWYADKAVADKAEDGWQAVMTDEAFAHVQAALQQVGRQFYYGRNTTFAGSGAAKGFPGLIDAYDATNMIVDAGGTTDNTASSVWAVCFGPQKVQWVFGANGQFQPSEISERDVADSASNKFTAYHQELIAYPGLQVSSTRFVSRIKKLTADSGKGLTDARLSALLETFPVGVRPDVLFMTKRSRRQLRDSRTATTATGSEVPQPMEYDGIPIVVTESLTNTETLAL
jgi:hypothetical protein